MDLRATGLMDKWIKPIIFVLALLPMLWWFWAAFTDQMGADPLKYLTHASGDWALRFLLLTLAITPLRSILKWTALLKLRRMLGLYSFFYALLHALTWVIFEHFFDVGMMLEDILERPYITVGFTSFMLLLPLALTSNNKMIRRLGVKSWKKLHKLVYVIAIGGVLHFLWLVKLDVTEPMIYIVVLFILLGWRVWQFKQNQKN
jgi:sulfoxide reductase heme-binding subunit YedZ